MILFCPIEVASTYTQDTPYRGGNLYKKRPIRLVMYFSEKPSGYVMFEI